MRLVLLVLLDLLLVTASFAEQTFKSINKYDQINKVHIDEHTLILLDIDNTIFRSSGHYGSFEFYAHNLKNLKIQKNLTTAQAKLVAFDIWIKLQEKITTKLIDEEIHRFIDLAKIKKATVFAFTARPPRTKQITYNQLAKYKIKLDQISNLIFKKSYNKQIFPDEEWCQKNKCDHTTKAKYYDADAIFYRGILFSNDINSKGEVLKDFYHKYVNYLRENNLVVPTKIVFVDDRKNNLESIQEAVTHLGLKFYGYHIKDDFKYDHEQALIEKKNLVY